MGESCRIGWSRVTRRQPTNSSHQPSGQTDITGCSLLFHFFSRLVHQNTSPLSPHRERAKWPDHQMPHRCSRHSTSQLAVCELTS